MPLWVRTCWLFGLANVLCACHATTSIERHAPAFEVAQPAELFTPAERRLLEAGQAVHRERDLTRGDQRYLGTVSYQLVKASPATVVRALSQPDRLSEVLPSTKRTSLIESRGRVQRVELVQGNAWVDAVYTVYLEREPEPGVRFWLDRSRAHDVDDAWGYFRAEPFDQQRTLMTVAVAVDIGSGLFRGLFAGAVQDTILKTPARIKHYAERLEKERRLAAGEGALALAAGEALERRHPVTSQQGHPAAVSFP